MWWRRSRYWNSIDKGEVNLLLVLMYEEKLFTPRSIQCLKLVLLLWEDDFVRLAGKCLRTLYLTRSFPFDKYNVGMPMWSFLEIKSRVLGGLPLGIMLDHTGTFCFVRPGQDLWQRSSPFKLWISIYSWHLVLDWDNSHNWKGRRLVARICQSLKVLKSVVVRCKPKLVLWRLRTKYSIFVVHGVWRGSSFIITFLIN